MTGMIQNDSDISNPAQEPESENFLFLNLPIELQINVLEFCSGQDVLRVGSACRELRHLVYTYRSALPYIQLYYVELDANRLKVWTDRASRIRIPAGDRNEYETYLRGTRAHVLSIAEANDELIDFVENLITKVGFKFEHLELEREIRCDFERISQLASLAKLTGIIFDTRGMSLDASLFQKHGFNKYPTIYFGMESGIGNDVLDECRARRLIVHQCDNVTVEGIARYFKRWFEGELQLDCARISVNRGVNMDVIFGDMNLIPTEYASVWKIQNKAKQTGKGRQSTKDRRPEQSESGKVEMKMQTNSDEPRRNSFCVWWHSVNVQIAIAAIGMSAGLMAGVVFAMQYQNWSAVTLCFTALLFSTLLLHIHLAYKWQRILEWPTALFNSLIYFNTLACVISLIGMVYCLVVAAIEGQGLTPEGNFRLQ
ncbi:hypothetical protein WR25_15838 isoform A [Diploscapter pachys]|uniref:F-box domain-containing protein n=1 Tax=Diploscapter pachys TaxID=2018661 RepID=A0A2A2J7H9_9BILA|nr:hypothetical protein WR25_15838 isoform A [Diploscapter pachys]